METITPAAFRTIRMRAAKELLVPAGFEETKELYVRQAGGQLHAIGVQVDRGEFAINLGFHYDFLPSAAPGRPLEERLQRRPEEFSLNDYLLHTRLGFFQADGVQWWSLGGDPAEAARLLDAKLHFALEVLDHLAWRWREPEMLLRQLTPEVLLQEAIIPEQVQEPVVGTPAALLLMYPFSPQIKGLCEFCRILAERKDDATLAAEYRRAQAIIQHRYQQRGW
jgi:uncharacterized protein DUF4304